MDEVYDYIIIGSGIAGLSAAYHLSKDGHSVLVLEANDGERGASFASTAEMNHDPDAHWETVVKQFGIDGAKLLWKLCSDAIDTLSEFAHQNGEPHFNAERLPAYMYSYRKDDTELLKDKYDFYTSIGAHVSFDDDASSLYPSFVSALTTHGEGVTNNQMLVTTLAHCVREQKGTILHDHPVTKIEGDVVTTPHGTFKGKKIIIATGDGGGLLPSSVGIEKKRTFVVSYEHHDLPEFLRNSVMWDTDTPYHYIRTFAGNRLWVGGEDVHDAEYVPSEEEDEKKYALIDAYAEKILHTDGSYKRQAAWSGLFYPAKRSLPYIGEVPETHQIASVGFGGTGVITSFISGYLIAAWSRGEMLEYKPLFALDWS
jgi:glycine/D-amino acid oxidase-like deaminating enzyme